MVARNYLKASLLAAGVMLLVADPSALAQQRLQTPDGRQTVAPSDMPQQPTLNEDFANPSKQNQRVSPPSVGVDMPGMPGVETPGRKATTPPGIIRNEGVGQGEPTLMQPAPQDARGTVASPRTGGTVLPQGVPSSVRIGPVEPVPVWQRAALAIWLTAQLAVLVILGVIMQLNKRRNEDLYQGGSIIDRDRIETRVHHHVPHTP